MKVFNSKYADSNERCEHGYLANNCPSCSSTGRAEAHHAKVFNLIQHFVPTLEDISLVGRPEHPPIIQNVINEIASDHQGIFPNCRHCATLRGEQPAAPDIMDLLDDQPIISDDIPDVDSSILGDMPTTQVPIVDKTQQIPIVRDFD